ncbi:family 10 glycosylhydrolase [Asanoa sp. WMMD1127]|uniref:glycoside hydrolase family 10 protein n=1 Tax=Asanoa sp. WMMD1127 TaxID=3016107 RepID=UPI002415E67A|nr:family 10 glycosylhydrolase [Asanoa sp. WMMD1127]MDG4824526.1 family 10 glycosylhydrolase [Asanoa sp. WMMD1127]
MARRLGAALGAAALTLSLLAVVAPAPAAATGSSGAAGTATCVTDPAAPKRQFRAMWISSVVNIDWPTKASQTAPDVIAAQKAEYLGWLDLAERLNHTAVIVQVRPTADAFWPSPHEPWSEFLTGVRGQDPGWDPLAFVIDEAHKRNLEFHAWMNPYRVSMPDGAGVDINKLAPNHPVRQHPDWVVPYPINAAGARLYYNPGIPEVRAFVQTAMLDAVKRYDVDGVHFDDYFYPYPAANQDFADDATFAAYNRGFTDKADWRRDNINLLVQEFGTAVKAAKPWVKFGISPFGIWRNKTADPLGSDTAGSQSYDIISADTRKWVKEEWIDYIVPQIYWSMGFTVADYAKLVPWWSDVVSGTNVQLYIGEADYKIAANADTNWNDPREMTDHLAFAKGYNVSGHVHFSAVQVRANKLGATDIYAAEHYAHPALVPTMSHLPSKPLLFPVVTSASRDSAGVVTLRWKQPANGAGPFGKATSYAVYRFDGIRVPTACDRADATHLLDTVRAESFVDTTAQPGQRYTYVVTALDRLWNESPGLPTPVF